MVKGGGVKLRTWFLSKGSRLPPLRTSGVALTAFWSFLLNAQRQPRATLDVLRSVTTRCDVAPTHVGLKNSRLLEGRSQVRWGSEAVPASSSSMQLAALWLNVHASWSCAGDTLSGWKRTATRRWLRGSNTPRGGRSANCCDSHTPPAGVKLPARLPMLLLLLVLRGATAKAKCTGVSPSLMTDSVACTASPCLQGGKLMRLVLSDALGACSGLRLANVLPHACREYVEVP